MKPQPQIVSEILRIVAWMVLGGGIGVTLFAAIDRGMEAGWLVLNAVLLPTLVGWATLLGFYAVLVLLMDVNDVLWAIAAQNEDENEEEEVS